MSTTIDDLADKNERETLIKLQPLATNSTVSSNPHIPSVSASAVLGESAVMPEGTPTCKGFDFNSILSGDQSSSDVLAGIIDSMRSTGFQATNLGMAVDEINRMRSWRLSDVPFEEGVDDPDLKIRRSDQRSAPGSFLPTRQTKSQVDSAKSSASSSSINW